MALSAGRCAIVLAAAWLLGGCRASNEDRINAAIPVGAEIERAAENAMSGLPSPADILLEAEYHARLDERARACGRGYRVSMLSGDQTIRHDIGNEECFREVDRNLLRWLGWRRAAWLLALPPLRPVPTVPAAVLRAPGRITRVAIADDAGVAVLQSDTRYRVSDLGDGATIHEDAAGTDSRLSLSPNGRLLACMSRGEARLHDAETGEILVTLEGLDRAGQLFWMEDKGVIFARPGPDGPVYLDAATATESRIRANTPLPVAVVRVPGTASLFALVGPGRVVSVRLAPRGLGWTPTVVAEDPLEDAIVLEGEAAPATPDAVWFYATGGALHALHLDTRASQSTSFHPMRLLAVSPTRDPDRLLITARSAGSSAERELFLYSPGDDTIAPVDDRSLPSTRLLYIPSLRSYALVDGDRMAIGNDIIARDPVPLRFHLAKLRGSTTTAPGKPRDSGARPRVP